MRQQVFRISVTCFAIAIAMLVGSNHASAQCEGQGNATLLMKGKCDIGSSAKYRMAGVPRERYKLLLDFGDGPTELPGVGTFCLDFSANRHVISAGRFNNRGFAAVRADMPSDPGLVGERVSIQFGSLDEDAPNGVAISNAYRLDLCAEGTDGDACASGNCELPEFRGLSCIGFISPVLYDGGFPAEVTVRVEDADDSSSVLGEASFAYDPGSPPELPFFSANGQVRIDKITVHVGAVIVHSTVETPMGRLPGRTSFSTTVGDLTLERSVDTSCETPIGVGGKIAPMFLDKVEPFDGTGFLILDEDAIDNGLPPNFFSANDVNDDIAEIGVRDQLRYFAANVGETITLWSGQVGDEGWFAVKTIPDNWVTAGPTDDGLMNYLLAGPGLGSADSEGDRESLLDKIDNVTPLRATGLKQLEGCRFCAVVYDSDLSSVNYDDPINASLKGANLGIVAFEVLEVRQLFGESSSSLPEVDIRILDAEEYCEGPHVLNTSAPVLESSSEPFDIDPDP